MDEHTRTYYILPFLLDLTSVNTTASFSLPWKPSTDLISRAGYRTESLWRRRSTFRRVQQYIYHSKDRIFIVSVGVLAMSHVL